jgi:hypothetical protein
MKITALLRDYSDANKFACSTEPPITPRIFGQFKKLISTNYGPLKGMNFDYANSIIVIQAASLTVDMRDSINTGLNEAAKIIEKQEQAKREAEEENRLRKEQAIHQAAAVLGVPVQ